MSTKYFIKLLEGQRPHPPKARTIFHNFEVNDLEPHKNVTETPFLVHQLYTNIA